MTKMERQSEIIRILIGRQRETMANLASDLKVSVRTIHRDVLELMVDSHYPLDTFQGNGGGVSLSDWHHPHRNIFSNEQQKVLTELISVANPHQQEVLHGLINAYGKPMAKGR